MTHDAIITVLMALGMSEVEAYNNLGFYCSYYGELPYPVYRIGLIWKAHYQSLHAHAIYGID